MCVFVRAEEELEGNGGIEVKDEGEEHKQEKEEKKRRKKERIHGYLSRVWVGRGIDKKANQAFGQEQLCEKHL